MIHEIDVQTNQNTNEEQLGYKIENTNSSITIIDLVDNRYIKLTK